MSRVRPEHSAPDDVTTDREPPSVIRRRATSGGRSAAYGRESSATWPAVGVASTASTGVGVDTSVSLNSWTARATPAAVSCAVARQA